MYLVLEHRDAQGNIKPIWQENKLFLWLIRKGLVSPKAPKIPFLFGHYSTHKEIEVS